MEAEEDRLPPIVDEAVLLVSILVAVSVVIMGEELLGKPGLAG